jgi:hypothetical protein
VTDVEWLTDAGEHPHARNEYMTTYTTEYKVRNTLGSASSKDPAIQAIAVAPLEVAKVIDQLSREVAALN